MDHLLAVRPFDRVELLTSAVHRRAVDLYLVRVGEAESRHDAINSRDQMVQTPFKESDAGKHKITFLGISGRTRVIHVKDMHGVTPHTLEKLRISGKFKAKKMQPSGSP